MEQTSAGQLVTVADGGPAMDGIVFDVPSRTKVVVAVVDPDRGPVFRTVHPRTLTERPEEGAHDRALNLLMRRAAPAMRGQARAGEGAGRGRSGHGAASMHRTTGK